LQPAQIKFKAITENSISNTWDYNNGVTNTTIADSSLYTYTTGGHYIPKLILEDANGCKVPIIGKDTIKVKYIDAHLHQIVKQYAIRLL
jgi:PKD repeat protein